MYNYKITILNQIKFIVDSCREESWLEKSRQKIMVEVGSSSWVVVQCRFVYVYVVNGVIYATGYA